jgi:hypothetical protein
LGEFSACFRGGLLTAFSYQGMGSWGRFGTRLKRIALGLSVWLKTICGAYCIYALSLALVDRFTFSINHSLFIGDASLRA